MGAERPITEDVALRSPGGDGEGVTSTVQAEDGPVPAGPDPTREGAVRRRATGAAVVGPVALLAWTLLALLVRGDRTPLGVDRALAGPAGRLAAALDPGGMSSAVLAGRAVLVPAACLGAALLWWAHRLGDRRARWIVLTGPTAVAMVAVIAKPLVDRSTGALFGFPSVPVAVVASLGTVTAVLAARVPAGRVGAVGRPWIGILAGTALTVPVAAAVVGAAGVLVTDVVGGILLGVGGTASTAAVIDRVVPAGRPLVRSRLVRGVSCLVGASSVWLVGLVPSTYLLLTPGSLIRLDRAVSVAPAGGQETSAATALHGTYSGLTVRASTLTLGRWVRYELSGSSDDIVPRTAVIPAGQGTAEHRRIEQQAFVDASAVAVAVAQQAAGEDVVTVGDGALITAVGPGSPAEGVLQRGDVVIELAGRTVATEADLRAALVAATVDAGIDPTPFVPAAPDASAGDPAGPPPGADGDPAAGRTVPVTLVVRDLDGAVRTTSTELRRLERSGRFGLGVGVTTANLRFVPGPSASTVRVDGGKVGGPSAGLLTALAVYDVLVPEDLAAGRHVTGTGTLAADGTVGRIGGIDEKVRAARSAGADVFLVPAVQVDQAEAAAAGRIRVVGVATFDEALAVLRASGQTTDT